MTDLGCGFSLLSSRGSERNDRSHMTICWGNYAIARMSAWSLLAVGEQTMAWDHQHERLMAAGCWQYAVDFAHPVGLGFWRPEVVLPTRDLIRASPRGSSSRAALECTATPLTMCITRADACIYVLFSPLPG